MMKDDDATTKTGQDFLTCQHQGVLPSEETRDGGPKTRRHWFERQNDSHADPTRRPCLHAIRCRQFGRKKKDAGSDSKSKLDTTIQHHFTEVGPPVFLHPDDKGVAAWHNHSRCNVSIKPDNNRTNLNNDKPYRQDPNQSTNYETLKFQLKDEELLSRRVREAAAKWDIDGILSP
ncbi:unnamed protein product [Caenorhabditis brenneri]